MTVLPGFSWIDNPRSGGGSYATDGPSCILLHMTVSMGISPSYISGHPYPPHFWANPYTGDLWQTISPDRSAFALYQADYGNSWTNKKGYTLQTEIVGVPEVNVATYTDEQCRWIGENVVAPQAVWLDSIGNPVNLHQVKYHDNSSGSASEYWPGRMSEAEWDSFNGLCAHIDCPYNDHWDCSTERLDLIAQYALNHLGSQPPPVKVPFPLEALDMFVGQDQSNGRIYVISGNTKLEMPVGGSNPGSVGNGNIYVDEWFRMMHEAYPDAGWSHLVALNPDIVNRIPDAYLTIDGSAPHNTVRTEPGEIADPDSVSMPDVS